MNECPNCPIIYLQTAFSQFANKPAQGEVLSLAAFKQPVAVTIADRFGLVPTHLTGRNAAGRAHALDPVDGGADRNTKTCSRSPA